MPETREFTVALTTCPNRDEADRIAYSLVERKLAACVTVLPGARSIYRWKEKMEVANEVVLLIKTRKALAGEVEKAVRELHSYELPEFLTLDVDSESERYLDWLRMSTL